MFACTSCRVSHAEIYLESCGLPSGYDTYQVHFHKCSQGKPSLLCQQDCKCLWNKLRGSLFPSWGIQWNNTPGPHYALYNNLHPQDMGEVPLITRNSLKRGLTKRKILFLKGKVFIMLTWISYEKPSQLKET